jgi:hypothetical protein
MRTLTLSLLIALSPLAIGATASQTTSDRYRPTTTMRDIMDAMIDPSADALWEAVSVTIDAEKITQHFPKTDEEWAVVRRHAVVLIEASNLLLIPDRPIAKPGTKSQTPGIELEPAQIERLIATDRDSWIRFSNAMHDVAQEMLNAIEMKNAEKLGDLGAKLDHACEQCHLKYWYPQTPATPPARR